jgi:hypothetical protein
VGYVIANSHRTSRIWAPPSTPPRPLWLHGMLSVTSMPLSMRCWRGHGGRRHPVDPLRAEAAVDRSGAAQGDPGDLVRRVLRHAALVSSATSRLARCTRCSLAGRGSACWRRLLNRLILAWRQACGDIADSSAVIIDSRSCRSAPTCFGRGFDGGKKIKGIKVHLAVEQVRLPVGDQRLAGEYP